MIFDDSKRAIGVTFSRAGRIHHVYCRKEVIVSSGTIGSPQILMLSGVGPHDHLEELGVNLKKDNNQHMQFHISYLKKLS